ncbi:MAG: YkgJ family cysteine cluster protein [Thermodesulfobacteriota bacterium]
MTQLPENVRQLADDEEFSFACHPGVPCFNQCCRELELALTPYDVLRLCRHLGITTGQFLEQYAVVEDDDQSPFPRVYLAMVDDGRASCPFVSADGCSVYPHRPAPCRTYPLGRAAFHGPDGRPDSFHVIIKEEHCHGFSEDVPQTIASWTAGQGLTEYNRHNDAMLAILQHPDLGRGMQPKPEQRQLFLTCLYDLDDFRGQGRVEQAAELSDEEMLLAAINWLRLQIFGFFKF